MNIHKDIKVEGKHGRPFLLDTFYTSTGTQKPVVIFAHGFKGFKDWGHWDLLANHFAMAGFFFVKFNFAFNGTSINTPLDFEDLEAFGMNNYSKESDDIDIVLNWLEQAEEQEELDINNVTLIGHSRGGGLAITKAAQDKRIHRLITWAAVAELGFGLRYPQVLESWAKDGVHYVMNGRTKQNMPLYYQLHEDYIQHESIFNIEKVAQFVQQPWLIIHGSEDPAVHVEKAHLLYSWNPSAQLHIIEQANHVFGGSHPYSGTELPEHSQELLRVCLEFLG